MLVGAGKTIISQSDCTLFAGMSRDFCVKLSAPGSEMLCCVMGGAAFRPGDRKTVVEFAVEVDHAPPQDFHQ